MDLSGFFTTDLSSIGWNAVTALPQSVQQLGIPVDSPPPDCGHLTGFSVQGDCDLSVVSSVGSGKCQCLNMFERRQF